MKQGARAGDVLVLVRQRGPLFEAIIRALKDSHVPVAGADRLVLTEHIAVMDLMVLADALLLPDDDLALATVLKSPLFGFDDDDLFELAWKRRGSLWAALRAKAQAEPRFADALAKLERFGEWAQEMPFAFYARVLGAEGGRKRFLARLGHEADDALDEFLNLALEYERRETPSLQGFVAWLRAAQTDVKRDMEITRDEVRVMTVHGAKGLEAPIVVLADTTTPPAGPPQRQPRLLSLEPATPHSPNCLVWAGAKATDTAPLCAARERARREAEDEYRRLLYVAMTRAIDRLVICGAEGERVRPEGCWWNLVTAALNRRFGRGARRRWRGPRVALSQDASCRGRSASPPGLHRCPRIRPPPWLYRNATAEPPPVRLLSPAAAYDETTPARAAPPAAASSATRRWSEAGWCTGCCRRCPTFRRRHVTKPLDATLPDRPPAFLPRNASACSSKFGGCSTILASRRCFCREAALRSPSLVASRAAGLRSPARSIASR